jgi:pSer/pThr/pTyr-binding forkhead associated (FHA) protein/uncharacterized coiled-coil protein SlyX
MLWWMSLDINSWISRNKWKITKFFKAQKIHDDIDTFTNAMKKLMDILSFKIMVKNSEKIDQVNSQLETMMERLKEIDKSTIEQKELNSTNSEELKQWMKSISSKLKDNTSAYKNLEYHCRFPGRALCTATNSQSTAFTFSVNEEEKKTVVSDEQEFDYSSKFDAEEVFTLNMVEYMTIRVIYSLDENFEANEYFKYKGKKWIHSDYEVRNWGDKYTAVKFGRFTYSLTDKSRVLNDIAFDAEIVNSDTKKVEAGDKNVSKEHATILFDSGQYYLADLGSINSTFLKVNREIILREGLVLDIWKDNLVVVHQIITDASPQFAEIYDSNDTMDPYQLFADGKLIGEEFQSLNQRRKECLIQEPGYKHIEKIELRFLKENKGIPILIFLGNTKSELISITKAQLLKNSKVTIGRGLDWDIRIQGDPAISRNHWFISLNECNEFVLNSWGHDVFMSIRLESEWPEVRFDFDEEFGDQEYEEYKRQNREPSTPIVLTSGMQMRISDTLFELEFN